MIIRRYARYNTHLLACTSTRQRKDNKRFKTKNQTEYGVKEDNKVWRFLPHHTCESIQI